MGEGVLLKMAGKIIFSLDLYMKPKAKKLSGFNCL